MKAVGKLFSYTILAINAFFAVILLLSAYSPYIRPGAQGIMTAMGMMFPFFVVINILFLLFWLIFRSKYFFLPLITLLVCLPEIRLYIPFNFRTSNIPENSIKVLSYNVMSFDLLKTKNGENKILNYIKDNNADIVCIQEYSASGNTNYLTQKKIEAVLNQYPYHSTTQVGNTSATNGMALYSKYPILSTKKINYPSQYNGSTAYEVKIGEDTLLVINNHLESNKLTGEDKATFTGILKDPGDTEKVKSGAKHLIKKLGEASAIRSVQVDSIAEFIEKSPHEYILVCGDFNDSPISYSHRKISKGLKDAFKNSGNGPGVSYNRNRFYFRIDHILTSKNIKAYNCTVDRSLDDSDHYPIYTYIKLDK